MVIFSRRSDVEIMGRRILIVDDEPEAPRMLKRLLERKCHYEVLVENDSRNALSCALTFRPDLILLDVIMPWLDGGDVARLIRQTDTVQSTPIIFISAIAQPIAGYPFLTKPAPFEQVIACIEENLPG